MKFFLDKISTFALINELKNSLYEFWDLFKNELKDNKRVFLILKRRVLSRIDREKYSDVTQDEIKKVYEQMVDNLRLLIFIVLGIVPGGGLLLIITIRLAKRFNIKLKPSKTFET